VDFSPGGRVLASDGAGGRADRIDVLIARAEQIADDCQKVLGDVQHPLIVSQARLAIRTPQPESLSRHVSVHQADPAHYTRGNATVAAMLVASVLRALQEFQEAADTIEDQD
jgi:hypothetical protein